MSRKLAKDGKTKGDREREAAAAAAGAGRIGETSSRLGANKTDPAAAAPPSTSTSNSARSSSDASSFVSRASKDAFRRQASEDVKAAVKRLRDDRAEREAARERARRRVLRRTDWSPYDRVGAVNADP